jgi:putative SOS response-associated peptidase YedK
VGALEGAGQGHPVQTFTIITGPPNALVAPIHNRMPVALPPSALRLWLGEEDEPDQLLRSYGHFPPE